MDAVAAMPWSDAALTESRCRKQPQSRLLHNFTTINAANAQGPAKLHAINRTEVPR
jgi:hypothetical protein